MGERVSNAWEMGPTSNVGRVEEDLVEMVWNNEIKKWSVILNGLYIGPMNSLETPTT